MSRRRVPSPPVPTLLTAAMIALLLGVAGLAPAAPRAFDPQPARAPDDLRESLLRHRWQEAQSKARTAAALARAETERTANQAEYDVHHYDLDLTLDPAALTLTGTVAATVEVIGTAISTLDLNLDSGLTVSGATSGGVPVSYVHANDIVTVTLDQTYVTGDPVTVSVSYSGNPAGDSFGWSYSGGQRMIWTLSEPYGAREWWPCKDLNSDKADSVDIQVTLPDNLIVASNGLLISDIDHGTTRTFHWRTNYPIATYLVSLACHPYTTFSDWYTPQGGGDPMEIQFFVFPANYAAVQENYAKTKDMIATYAQAYGEYPFLDEKYGHAEFTWGGGMEHQTITSLGGHGEDLISHELAHQWWGDMITCADFGHIWLNEGFATWSEAYWKENVEGFATYQAYMDAAAYYGAGTIFVEDPSDFSAIFDVNLSYNKASWVVHMLRHVMGDEDFIAGLALYRSAYGYGSATTEQFRDAMEAACGLDLDSFFEQWIYGEYFPVYSPSWSQRPDGTVDLTIDQVQTNAGLFTMPIDVRIETTAGTFDFVVQNSLASETYSLPVTGTAEAVLLDPDRWILRQVQTTVTNPTFAEGILVVNGVDWGTYNTEITTAYADSIFWGDNSMTFWDTFSEPAGGYPANLPEPLGHGSVPGDILGQYSAVVWIGNDYNGDLPKWQETPILSYLAAGGNVLLLSRRGQSFLAGDCSDYLGITWTATAVTLVDCVSHYTGLVDIPFTGSQSYNDVFSTSVGPNSTLLFEDAGGSGDRGTGVHAQPPGGGTHRPDGGQFVHVAGRPYRMNHDALRTDVEFILEDFFGEPYAPTSAIAAASSEARFELHPLRPNPFRGETWITFELPARRRVDLSVYDVGGRLVRRLLASEHPAGRGSVRWDGADWHNRPVAAGVYYVRLSDGSRTLVRPLVRLR
jgi:aminopeptidase N